jgi:predicted RND superfamily exporter protein
MSAPIVILTLAVADSIHILMSLRSLTRDGLRKNEALIEAVRINFLPVTITSLTTVVDSPPYWHLGNITAVGIFAAWVFSVTVLPAAISLLPYRVKEKRETAWSVKAMDALAEFVIRRYRGLLVGVGLPTLAIIAFTRTRP